MGGGGRRRQRQTVREGSSREGDGGSVCRVGLRVVCVLELESC